MTLPLVIPVSAACYVLDEYLLLAHHDGVLRDHPRRNPRSTYHVEDLGSLVPRMTSRFNVVALIRDCWVLEVRRVFKRHDNQDPFIGFELLYSVSFADGDYAPLLCGPYVVFRGLDGSWYRVCYDNHDDEKKKTTAAARRTPDRTASSSEATENKLPLIRSATRFLLELLSNLELKLALFWFGRIWKIQKIGRISQILTEISSRI